MMPGRHAGCVAWRGEDWLSCQAARRSLRAFQASPHHFQFNRLGPALSVRRPCGLRTDRAGDDGDTYSVLP